jgi:hypothetical protein
MSLLTKGQAFYTSEIVNDALNASIAFITISGFVPRGLLLYLLFVQIHDMQPEKWKENM